MAVDSLTATIRIHATVLAAFGVAVYGIPKRMPRRMKYSWPSRTPAPGPPATTSRSRWLYKPRGLGSCAPRTRSALSAGGCTSVTGPHTSAACNGVSTGRSVCADAPVTDAAAISTTSDETKIDPRMRVERLFEFSTGPLRSHPTAEACAVGTPRSHPIAQACAVGTPRCRGQKIAVEGLLGVVLKQFGRSTRYLPFCSARAP